MVNFRLTFRKLSKSGQTACYDADGNGISCAGTGQDGDLQKGVAWPSPRFTNNNDQTITDNLTGLMWTQNGNAPGPDVCTPGVTKNWQPALDYVTCLNTNNYLGYNDWRLPNTIELTSLDNLGTKSNEAWLSTQGFNNLIEMYVSSTTYAKSAHYYWTINMERDGLGYMLDMVDKNGDPYKLGVWPVRGGQ